MKCALAPPVLCCLAQVWTVVTGETLHALTAGPDWRQAMTLPVPLEDQLRTLWLRLRHAALWHLLKEYWRSTCLVGGNRGDSHFIIVFMV